MKALVYNPTCVRSLTQSLYTHDRTFTHSYVYSHTCHTLTHSLIRTCTLIRYSNYTHLLIPHAQINKTKYKKSNTQVRTQVKAKALSFETPGILIRDTISGVRQYHIRFLRVSASHARLRTHPELHSLYTLMLAFGHRQVRAQD